MRRLPVPWSTGVGHVLSRVRDRVLGRVLDGGPLRVTARPRVGATADEA
ncbi:hypothetical protein ACFQYP_08570 [Nonomuraea antimicrobica]